MRLIIGFFLLLLCFSCQSNQEQEAETEEFILQDNFQIEIVAKEPLLDSPVAMTFDQHGNIWVVEMTGYMRDIDGTDEDFPDGRIVILKDIDGNGQMDTREIFLDSLIAPRALALVYNGLLYTDSTSLWWTSIENNRPGEKVLVDSLYVIGGNIEHQSNGLLYNLDNWIYSAKSNARYRRIDGKWQKEASTSRGQWGITNDDEGRLYYNDNSNPLMGDYIQPNQLIANPYYKSKYGYNQQITEDRQVFPLQPTAVNRGYMEGVLDENQKLRYFTSACGPVLYRGGQFGDSFYGNAFVCGPEANLIKRYVMKEEKGRVEGLSAYSDTEFLLSKNEAFRPVNLYNGPDGALYIVDMRKGIIQHRAYMTSYLREQILGKGLDTITGIGRIYRVIGLQNEAYPPTSLSSTPSIELVNLLQHPNAYIREKAQQGLIFNDHKELKAELKQVALASSYPFGQIHALWTLEGLELLSYDLLLQVGKESNDASVMSQILKLSILFPDQEEALRPVFERAISMNNTKVDLQLCYLLGQHMNKESKGWWLQLAEKYPNDALFSEALISGVAGKEREYLNLLPKSENKDSLTSFIQKTIYNQEKNAIQAPTLKKVTFEDGRTRGANLYDQYCASCHGLDGTGNEFLAPPLVESEYLSGPSKRLVLLLLHGLQGPVTVNGKRYEMNLVMPGLKNTPALGDEEIRDLLVFIQNSFASTGADISVEEIGEHRAATENREEMYTEEELLNIEY